MREYWVSSLTLILILIPSLLFLAGCSGLFRKSNHPVWLHGEHSVSRGLPNDLKRVNKALLRGDVRQAMSDLEIFEVADGDRNFLSFSFYFHGWVAEERGLWEEALKFYRSLITRIDLDPSFRGHLLYRISRVWEKLGNDEQSLAALKDAWRIREFLPEELKTLLIPARLAIFYGQRGQTSQGQVYRAAAEEGLVRLRELSTEGGRQRLAWITYELGDMPNGVWPIDRRFRYFESRQPYLLESMAQKVSPWSVQSERLLLDFYEDSLVVIGKMEGSSDEIWRKIYYLLALLEENRLFREVVWKERFSSEKDRFIASISRLDEIEIILRRMAREVKQ